MKTISFLILQQRLASDEVTARGLTFIGNNIEIILCIWSFLALIYLVLFFRNLINESAEQKVIIEELQKQGKVILSGKLKIWDNKYNYVYGYFYEEGNCFVEINGEVFYKSAVRTTKLKEI